jgi:Putative porin
MNLLAKEIWGIMSYQKNKPSCRLSPFMAFLLCTTAALPAFVADPARAQSAAASASSEDVTINSVKLLDLMVKRKLISRADADALIHEASEQRTPQRATAAAPAAAAPATAAATAAPPNDGAVHVTYVPDIVKDQIRDEVKQQVMAQAKTEGWAAPNEVPSWVQRIHLYGDIRARYEGDMFPTGNDNTGGLPNFNAINTGSPFDASQGNQNFYPTLNVDQNRNRYRLRARLGAGADLGEGFSAGIRVASGENDSPVSENQSLGAANGAQGGDFAKYSIWLDRSFIRYDLWHEQGKALNLTVGRMDNPFFATNLIWADDLGFDGLAVSGKYAVRDDVTPFFTIGAFPVFNTDFNFASNQPAKFKSEDKWLYAIQAGSEWKINQDYAAKMGVAYYLYRNIEGKLSTPCTVDSASDTCSTDDSRPSFAQNGNTYTPLRNIIADAANNNGATSQFQYYGLATPFHELALTGHFDVNHFDPTHIWLDGEFVKNLAFDKSTINQKAVNNRGACLVVAADLTCSVPGPFEGGSIGWFVNASVGSPVLAQRWDWNVSLGYKHVESDAVVDGFTDSDFGLGGTNLKGFIVGGNLALSHNVWTRLRWLSADNIAGSPYKTDIVQLDLNTKF